MPANLRCGALAVASCLVTLSAHGAEPIVELTPPALYDCPLGVNFLAFGNCVVDEVTGMAEDAVDEAEASLNDTIANLEAGLEDAEQMLASPAVVAVQQLQMNDFITCLGNAGYSYPALLNQFMSDPPAFMDTVFSSLWHKIATQPQGMLADLDATSSLEDIALAADQAFVALASEDPIASCALPLLEPHRAAARQLALDLVPLVQDELEQLADSVLQPALEAALVDALKPVMAQLGVPARPAKRAIEPRVIGRQAARFGGAAMRKGTRLARSAVPDDVRHIAHDVARRYLLNPERMATLSAEVRQLAETIAGTRPGVAIDLGRLEGAQKAVGWDEQIALEVGVETVRLYGHRTIDAVAPPVINGVGSSVKDVAVNVADVVCGAFYEPGTIPCQVVETVLEAAVNHVLLPGIEKAITREVHDEYDDFVDAARDGLREGRPPSHYLDRAGPLGPLLLAHFPSENELLRIAIPELETMRTTLWGYHSAVLELAGAAAGRGRRR